jgi:hypothetical protein
VMELSPDGQRIEHTVPLRAFLDDGMCLAPFELPAPCDERTANMPESPDESGSDMMPSLEMLPEEAETGEEVLPMPTGSRSQRLPLSRFGMQ